MYMNQIKWSCFAHFYLNSRALQPTWEAKTEAKVLSKCSCTFGLYPSSSLLTIHTKAAAHFLDGSSWLCGLVSSRDVGKYKPIWLLVCGLKEHEILHTCKTRGKGYNRGSSMNGRCSICSEIQLVNSIV